MTYDLAEIRKLVMRCTERFSSCLQVTRIDGTVDSPPCLKVTHKTFGTQNSNADMVFCRLSMPVEFNSHFKSSPVVDMNGLHEEDTLKVKHRYSHCQSHYFGNTDLLFCFLKIFMVTW